MKEEDRFLRLFVFFDLPVGTERERSWANRFRRTLIKNGFFMIQFSIYCRICRGQQNVDKYKNKIRQYLPSRYHGGNIRMMQVTEKQFESMEILIGEMKKSEKFKDNQLLLF